MATQVSRLRAISDTIAVRIEQVSAFMDSVRVIEEGHLAESQTLERQTDSLRTVISEAEGRSLAASEVLRVFRRRSIPA
jgi:hypothetical protein